jgi:3-deoxy-D-manno-octulosonic-acid transferase
VRGKERGDRNGLTMLLYSAMLLAVLVLGSPYWLVRMLTSGRYRAGLAGRLGRVPAALRTAVQGRQVVWVHAVSVGEVLAATRLVTELEAALGDGWIVAVSTTTQTGQELARQRFPQSPVFYLPLDFAFLMRRYLAVLKPRLVVLMESELWPNMIRECHQAGVLMAVVNARVSDRSFPRYMWLRRLWRPRLEEISLFLAQSTETAERLVRIGAPAERVRLTGNLKYDVQSPNAGTMTRRIESLRREAKLIVAGSTLEGEEDALLAAWPTIHTAQPDAALLIAPRHKDRFDAVEGMLRRSGFGYRRCSSLLLEDAPIDSSTIFLLDTIGDLASIYSLATVAFVGGSLVRRGGHNPLEPAQFGVPVVIGPSYENFREIVEAMRAEDAIRIVPSEGLAESLLVLLKDSTGAQALGERGRQVFLSKAGATERVVRELMGLLR